MASALKSGDTDLNFVSLNDSWTFSSFLGLVLLEILDVTPFRRNSVGIKNGHVKARDRRQWRKNVLQAKV
jgi:hypothetical protein